MSLTNIYIHNKCILTYVCKLILSYTSNTSAAGLLTLRVLSLHTALRSDDSCVCVSGSSFAMADHDVDAGNVIAGLLGAGIVVVVALAAIGAWARRSAGA